MQAFRKRIRENPLLGSLIVTLLCFVCNELISRVGSLMPDGIVWSYIHEVICILWPLALVYVCGYMDIFRRRGLRRAFTAGMLIILVYGFNLAVQITTSVSSPDTSFLPMKELMLSVFMLIGVGIREEAIYRGIIVNLYADKHFGSHKELIYTMVASSFFFGIIHMGNLLSGIRLESTLVQVLVAWAVGMVNCAIYLRSGSIWGLIVLHMLVDGSGMFSSLFCQRAALGAETVISTAVESINTLGLINLIPILWFLPLAFFLLRKKKAQEILERNQKFNAHI